MRDDEAREIGAIVGELIDAEVQRREAAISPLAEAVTQLRYVVDALRLEVSTMVNALGEQPAQIEVEAQRCRNIVDATVTRAAEQADAARAAIDAALAGVTAAMESATARMAAEDNERWAVATSALLSAIASLRNGDQGEQGLPGEPGQDGRDGSIAEVRAYQVGEIYRAGDVVSLPFGHPSGWAVAKCLSDTYEIPGDDEAPWAMVVAHGQDGRGMRYRGIYHATNTYAVNDVVTNEGATWVRVRDAESQTLPGEGWAVMIRAPQPGAKGDSGLQGEAGRDGVGIDRITAEGADLVFTLTDQSVHRVAMPVIYLEGAP